MDRDYSCSNALSVPGDTECDYGTEKKSFKQISKKNEGAVTKSWLLFFIFGIIKI